MERVNGITRMLCRGVIETSWMDSTSVKNSRGLVGWSAKIRCSSTLRVLVRAVINLDPGIMRCFIHGLDSKISS